MEESTRSFVSISPTLPGTLPGTLPNLRPTASSNIQILPKSFFGTAHKGACSARRKSVFLIGLARRYAALCAPQNALANRNHPARFCVKVPMGRVLSVPTIASPLASRHNARKRLSGTILANVASIAISEDPTRPSDSMIRIEARSALGGHPLPQDLVDPAQMSFAL